MPRFAAVALFAALLSSAFAQDDGNRIGPDKPAADRQELKEKDRKAAEPGAPARPPRPQQPGQPVPPPVVVPAPEMLPVLPSDGRIAALGDGFVLLDAGDAGDRFVARDKDGKEASVLFSTGQKVERWWLAADGKRVLWVSGGKLFAAAAGAKSADDLGGAPLGAPAVSPDGKRVAFVRDGKLVVRDLDAASDKLVAPADGLLLGDAAAWSLDGRKVFALVGASANEPDGIGAADLAAEAPGVARIYQATGATLSNLALASTGKWLLFVQTTKTDPKQAALRLFAPDGSEFRTLARAAAIADPAFAPDALHAYFSARGANGRWQCWEAGLEPDAATGEIVVRKIVEEENRQFARPVVGADGNVGWFVRTDAEGKGAQVGKVKLR